jgi:hypothetical protein
MATVTFDTLTLVKELEEAGIPHAQAEAIVRAIATAQDGIVTRDYLSSQLDLLARHIDTKIADARADIIKWLAGLLLAQAALVATLVKLL